MKPANKYLFIISLFLFNFVSNVYASGSKMPEVAASPTASGPYVEQIVALADSSTCAQTTFTGRGKAPAGYIKGVALSFARSLCRAKSGSSLSSVMAKSAGSTTSDALAYYQSKFAESSISIGSGAENSLRALYTIGMGLGMRESSGRYCEGWDRSAGANRSSSAGEAGIYQTSYDSMGLSSELRKLYEEYKSRPELCHQDVFREGVSCGPINILGSGAGADYQEFNIKCPAFAAEYAMTMLRIARSHYGPINRKEVQVVPACNDLLKSVEDLINSDPYACQDLL